MPTIFFYCPKLDREKKKEVIKSFTDTASKVTGIDKSAFVVYLRESTPENVGVGGELLEDVHKRRG
jgi:4-oxalocrotonate tautomerase